MALDPRTAPRTSPEQPRGSNIVGVRAYNERLVLSLIRRHGSLPKADIARLTGLSAQTISVIVRALEADGLLLRMTPQRGRVGQPSVPLRLDPDGAYSLGLKVGRRSANLILMDFVGGVRRQIHWSYPYPAPADLFAALEQGIAELTADLTAQQNARIVGLGVATPYELWNWAEQVGAPQAVLDAWRAVDLKAELEARCPWPVLISNDATAACGAELTFGRGRDYPEFIYVFVGSFVGGGVVLDGSLYAGRRGNAGAIGSMPVPFRSGGGKGRAKGPQVHQLIQSASLYALEARLTAKGLDARAIFRAHEGWDSIGAPLADWLEEAAAALAHALVASVSVIDFAATIIDGGFPPQVRARLVALVREKIGEMDLQGLSPFAVIEGEVGANARSIGGASLPLLARFLLDRDVLFKDER